MVGDGGGVPAAGGGPVPPGGVVAGAPLGGAPPVGLFDPERLGPLSTWVSVGFTTLAALLAYLGVTQGFLDRLLGNFPTAALYIFCLLGSGLVLGIIAGALSAKRRIAAAWPVIVVMGAALVSLLLFPDYDEGQAGPENDTATDWPGWVPRGVMGLAPGDLIDICVLLLSVIAVVAFIYITWQRVAVLAPVAGILVAASLTSMGLYGAIKISVQSRNYVSEPQVTAAIGTDGAGTALTVTVKAARRSIDRRIDVAVIGFRDRVSPDSQSTDQEVIVLGRQTLTPDAAGIIDAQIKFPVVASRYAQIVVRQCDSSPGRTSYCGLGDEVVRVSGLLASIRGRLQGTITPNEPGTSAQVALKGSGLQTDASIVATVDRLRKGQPLRVAQAALFVGADGQIEWTLPVPITTLDAVHLNLQQCLEPEECDDLGLVAAYTAPD